MNKKAQLKQCEDAVRLLEDVRDARQQEWDDRSERWQESEAGTDHEAATEQLEDCIGAVNDWIRDYL